MTRVRIAVLLAAKVAILLTPEVAVCVPVQGCCGYKSFTFGRNLRIGSAASCHDVRTQMGCRSATFRDGHARRSCRHHHKKAVRAPGTPGARTARVGEMEGEVGLYVGPPAPKRVGAGHAGYANRRVDERRWSEGEI